MPEIPQIKRLLLSRFRQFGFCDLDFTNPKTGEILPQVCLLGPNGVGKSTILDLLYRSLDPTLASDEAPREQSSEETLLLTGFVFGDKTVYRASNGIAGCKDQPLEDAWFSGDIENSSHWKTLSKDLPGFADFTERFSPFRWNAEDASRIENCALAFFTPRHSLVDTSPVHGFREFLSEKREERQALYHDFLKEPENRDRTIAEVEVEFESSFPNLLTAIQKLWEPVLTEAFLAFDPDRETPITSIRTGEEIPFSALSPGLRQHLLRVALVFSQYFQNDSRGGFLFLDDPDTGLNPDLARSQMMFFQSILEGRKTQLFTSTHSPRVASLFSAEERIHLRFDEQSGVAVLPATTTTGDSAANDGEQKETSTKTTFPNSTETSRRFATLKRTIQETEDQDELADLIDELMELRNL